MKREFLESLGLEKEVIDKIMDENGKDINNAKGKKDDLEAKVSELEAERDKLKDTVDERDKQLETLKASAGDNEELQKQIEKLESDNKAALENHDKEMAELKKSHAIESALMAAKVKNVKAVLPFIDPNKVTVDDKGITGLSDQIEALKGADDTKFLFDSGQANIKGAEPGQQSDPKGDGKTADDIRRMSSIERSKYKEEHPEEYETLMGNN